MCWIYYCFSAIALRIGEEEVPSILCEESSGQQELMMLSVMSMCGCDILLLVYGGEEAYLKGDPDSAFCRQYTEKGSVSFPAGYCIRELRLSCEGKLEKAKLKGEASGLLPCTNTWAGRISGLSDIKRSVLKRGTDPGRFYNCFIRINGVRNPATYREDVQAFLKELKGLGRPPLVISGGFEEPGAEEINSISRGGYTKSAAMIGDIADQIRFIKGAELTRLVRGAFVDIMLEEGKNRGDGLNRLTGRAVYLICRMKKYLPFLMDGFRLRRLGVIVFL
jgi:hypothetical protein